MQIDTPHLPSGAYKLWLGNEFESEEDESHEDPSDENEQSDEQQNSQEPGSEDEDDDEEGDDDDGSDSGDDDDNDDNDNDDGDDEDNETGEQDDDAKKDAKKRVTKKKSVEKTHRRNKKLSHNKQKKSGAQITRKHNHKIKWQRVKRRVTTKESSQPARRFTHRGKLYARKNRGNHARRERRKWAKETLDEEEDRTSTTPRDDEEDTSDEDLSKLLETYADYVLKVARALAKARGTEISEEDIKKDIEDLIKFQVELIEVSIVLFTRFYRNIKV